MPFLKPLKIPFSQIKAAEIIDSDQYKTECTLRFPRVEKIRYDKPWHQCLTVAELEEQRQVGQGKLVFKRSFSLFVKAKEDSAGFA